MKETFPKMAELLAPAKQGEAEVRHYTISDHESRMSALRGGRSYAPPGKIAQLYVKGVLVMSDTRHEKMTNYGVVNNSQGHVFIAGLGLGMICHPIAAKEEVTKITVLETSQDVIDLVSPSLPEKVECVQGDVFKWKPAKGTKFDTIYFDIWPYITTDNLPEMAKLHRRFAKCKRSKEVWMESWCRNTLKSERRREQAHDRLWGY